jgi:hypothetical protein
MATRGLSVFPLWQTRMIPFSPHMHVSSFSAKCVIRKQLYFLNIAVEVSTIQLVWAIFGLPMYLVSRLGVLLFTHNCDCFSESGLFGTLIQCTKLLRLGYGLQHMTVIHL